MYAKHRPGGPARTALVLLTAVAGFAIAALVSVAFAKTFVLKVAKNASVTNTSGTTKHEGIVVNSRGFAVYTLSGDSARHQECTKRNGCFAAWPPVKASSAKKLSKAPGIKGKLGSFRRDGFIQVTLGGHPLYTFSADTRRNDATGDGINHFGGIWHVIKVGNAPAMSGPGSSSSTSSSTSSTSSSSTGYGY